MFVIVSFFFVKTILVGFRPSKTQPPMVISCVRKNRFRLIGQVLTLISLKYTLR